MTISGFRDNSNALNTRTVPATVNPIERYKNGLDVIAHSAAQLIASDLVEAFSTTTVINATAHSAKPGDIIIFTSGSLNKEFAHVFSTTANSITLSQILFTAPATLDAFDILRFSFSRVDTAGGTLITPIPPSSISSSPNNATSTAYEASRIIKASPGVCFGVNGYNSKTSPQFIQLHNAISVPADTAIPVITLIVPTGNFFIDFGAYPRGFSVGMVICNSSTGPTKTIGAADCWFDVLYL